MKKLKFLFFPTILALAFGLMLSCAKSSSEDSTSSDDTTAPTVYSTYPSNSASSVAPNISLTVTFSEAMDATTITTNSTGTSCLGTLQLSSDSFSTCLQMFTSPTASDSNKTFTLDPASNLSYDTTYKVKVTTDAKDSAGNALASAYTHSTGFTTSSTPDTTAPTVSSTTPADSASSVAPNTSLTVTFSEAMDTTTITTNSTGTSCLGTLQLSSDSFSTCVQMSASTSISNSNKTFTLNPASNLSYETTYKVKVTTDAKDSAGNALASAYTHSTGFTTSSTLDTTAPTVSSSSPADSASSVAPNTSLTVTFSEAMDTTTITTNTSNTTCSGSLQVSSDSFSTCVQMSASPSLSNSNKTFTVTPSSNLSSSTTYKIRVTTGVKDSAGNSLFNQWDYSSGFTTSSSG